ncbi:Glutamate--tRNA ligase mitochondrial [Parahypoxylon ruwenzoriense]
MKSLYIIRGPLCRPLGARPSLILKRQKFSARTGLGATAHKRSALPSTPARTRFAPSPTGYLHIGSLRTALYNYLLAKATGGQFLLRIEDTDQTRVVPDAEKRLYEDLKWAGLSWDEGPDIGGPYGPYKQSERIKTYHEFADRLIREGSAYPCFCAPEELDYMRSVSMREGRPTNYLGTCSKIPKEEAAYRIAHEPHCVRFRSGRRVPVDDLVYGHYKKPEKEDDFIIIKRDGYPTYHFANVVDDHLMEITHVIRGAEWLVSTPRHVALYEAFEWPVPQFAHVGLLVNGKKQKLSKRYDDVGIITWRDRGMLPITLLNYVMLLGWSPGKLSKNEQEAMNLNMMVTKFHLGFTKGDIIINNKYGYLQKEHLRRIFQSPDPSALDTLKTQVLPGIMTRAQLCEDGEVLAVPKRPVERGPLVPLAREGINVTVSKRYIEQVFDADATNYRDAESFIARNVFLIWTVAAQQYRARLAKELNAVNDIHVVDPQDPTQRTPRLVHELVAALRDLLNDIPREKWTKENLEEVVVPFVYTVHATPTPRTDELLPDKEPPAPEIWGYHLLRWILVASRPGPPLMTIMALLGREETLLRVERAHEVAEHIEGKKNRYSPLNAL